MEIEPQGGAAGPVGAGVVVERGLRFPDAREDPGGQFVIGAGVAQGAPIGRNRPGVIALAGLGVAQSRELPRAGLWPDAAKRQRPADQGLALAIETEA